EDGKLDYDSTLEDMVRDARVILSREVRHSILKITPGGGASDGSAPAEVAPSMPTESATTESTEAPPADSAATHIALAKSATDD
ncbi:MAG: hypothetical protein ABI114_17200, partial [Rhodanobacter sp.]